MAQTPFTQPTSIRYGKLEEPFDSLNKFATVLIDDYGERKESREEHFSLNEAKADSEDRQQFFRKLFGVKIPIVRKSI